MSKLSRSRKTSRSAPRLLHERALWQAGHSFVGGVDEVGRGAWAGPLTVAVVVIGASPGPMPRGLRDSKLLVEERREKLYGPVVSWARAWGVGHVSPADCDRLGMTAALRLASRRAFLALPPDLLPDAVVLDGNFDYVTPLEAPGLFDEDPLPAGWKPVVETVIKGDARCMSVAAASILAKVSRDRLMRADAACYPGFDFDRNKGYPSQTHQLALRGYGLTAVHRRSWSYVEDLPWR